MGLLKIIWTFLFLIIVIGPSILLFGSSALDFFEVLHNEPRRSSTLKAAVSSWAFLKMIGGAWGIYYY